MKPIQRKDLVIGEVYSDMPELEDATILRYVGRSELTNGLRFEYVSGIETYPYLPDGIVGFSDANDDPFYLIEEDSL